MDSTQGHGGQPVGFPVVPDQGWDHSCHSPGRALGASVSAVPYFARGPSRLAQSSLFPQQSQHPGRQSLVIPLPRNWPRKPGDKSAALVEGAFTGGWGPLSGNMVSFRRAALQLTWASDCLVTAHPLMTLAPHSGGHQIPTQALPRP